MCENALKSLKWIKQLDVKIAPKVSKLKYQEKEVKFEKKGGLK